MNKLISNFKYLLLLIAIGTLVTFLIIYIPTSNSFVPQTNDIELPPSQRSQLAINDGGDSIDINNDTIDNMDSIDIINIANINNNFDTQIFTKYLDPICAIKPSSAASSSSYDSYPSDCIELLNEMINITVTLNLDDTEIEILAQRIEYLTSQHLLTNPILFIHIPKTGGTGFGKWLEKNSKRRTVHIWIPDGMDEHMYDSLHFPNRNRRRLPVQHRPRRSNNNNNNRNRNNRMRSKKKTVFPQILYGHAAYGFDTLFLSPSEIEDLSTTSPKIMWKPRVNFTYITVMRNPLTRVPSHYFYHKAGPKDENHKWSVQRDLEHWIGFFEESKECLVQFISGCHHRAWYSQKYKDIFDPNLDPWPRRQPDESPAVFNGRNVTFEQYKIARLHLLEMGWVGLTEHLSESVEQLKVFWGLHTNQGSRNDNVNRKKPKQPLQSNVIAKILEYNQYDLNLWKLGYVLYLQQKIVVKYAYHVDIKPKQQRNH